MLRHSRRQSLCLIAALAALAMLPYLWGGGLRTFIHLDDDGYVFDNHVVIRGLTWSGVRWAFTTFHSYNWHPLTWISHMADVSLYGSAAGGHHLTSVLLHGLTTVLLFVVLERLTGRLVSSGLVAALFGAHPLRVESVAWVAERKDVLSGVFFVLVLLAYERYARRGGTRRYLVVAGVLALGLMAKPMLVTAPLVLLLLDFWPLGRWRAAAQGAAAAPRARRGWPGLILEKLPLLALCAASSLLTFAAQSGGGAVMDLMIFPPGVRLANGLVSYVAYLGKSAWPAALAVYYPHPLGLPPWWQLAGSVLLLGLVSLAAVRWLASRPYVAVGWLWYLGMLVPVIGFVQVGSQAMADRYTYLPGIGLAVILAWGAAEAARALRLKTTAAVGGCLVLVALAATTTAQVGRWQDTETLFRHTLAVTSDNWLIHTNLGNLLLQNRRTAEAIDHYREALRLRPAYAGAHQNLGIALAGSGHLEEGIFHSREAVRLNPRAPGPYVSLAVLLSDRGQTEEAIALCRTALSLAPEDPEAHNTLGIALARSGRLEEAVAHLEEALRLRPGDGVYLQNVNLARGAAPRTGAEILPKR